jgi:ribosomal-protein-alanine N-acetyltransferase
VRITSERFILRDFREQDRSAFLTFQSDPRLLARDGAEASVPGHAESLFQRFNVWASERPRRKYQLAAFHRKWPDKLIGCCGLRGDDGSERKADLGIALAPEYWARYAYAVEIAEALLEFGFRTVGVIEIRGTTASRNDQVGRLARWFGAIESGSFPASVAGELSQTEWHITREQWEASQSLRRTWGARIKVEPDT